MPTQKSLWSMTMRYEISAAAHPVYWFVFLNLAFSVGRVDFVHPDRIDSAAVLTAAAWVIAGIAILALLMQGVRRLPANAAAPLTRPLLRIPAKAAISAAYWIGAFVWLNEPLFAGLFGDIVRPNGEIVAGPSWLTGAVLMVPLLAGWAMISALWDRAG